jgi:hypothetical protein
MKVFAGKKKKLGGAPLLALFEKWPVAPPTPGRVAVFRRRAWDLQFEDLLLVYS